MDDDIAIDVRSILRFWREANEDSTGARWKWGCGEQHYKAAMHQHGGPVGTEVSEDGH